MLGSGGIFRGYGVDDAAELGTDFACVGLVEDVHTMVATHGSRYPSALTPTAAKQTTFTVRPSSRTFIVNASIDTNV